MKNFEDLDDFEYFDIIHEIEETYIEELLQPIAMSFIKFFIKVQNFEDGFRTHKASKDIKVVSIRYYANSRLSYIFAMNCYDFYKADPDVESPELYVQYYNDYDEDALIEKVFKKHHVAYDYNSHYDIWEGQYDTDINFLLDCWQKAKEITNSKLYAFLEASDGSGAITNMDTRESFKDTQSSVEKHLTAKGIFIEKDPDV